MRMRKSATFRLDYSGITMLIAGSMCVLSLRIVAFDTFVTFVGFRTFIMVFIVEPCQCASVSGEIFGLKQTSSQRLFIWQIADVTMIMLLGITALIVSMWDKFAKPTLRPLRAGVFVAMGLSGT